MATRSGDSQDVLSCFELGDQLIDGVWIPKVFGLTATESNDAFDAPGVFPGRSEKEAQKNLKS